MSLMDPDGMCNTPLPLNLKKKEEKYNEASQK